MGSRHEHPDKLGPVADYKSPTHNKPKTTSAKKTTPSTSTTAAKASATQSSAARHDNKKTPSPVKKHTTGTKGTDNTVSRMKSRLKLFLIKYYF